GWAHKFEPVRQGKWTEVWHTRLGVRKPLESSRGSFFVDERNTDANQRDRAVAAIRSPDYFDYFANNPVARPADSDASPFSPAQAALQRADRYDIVDRVANLTNRRFVPGPISVNRMMLSALGGWLDARGAWSQAPTNSLAEWRHIVAQGRDQYVRAVRYG